MPETPDVPGSQFTSLENGIPHPTVGCDGAVVLTPRPGTQFADPMGSMPASATSFYAKAATLHMIWASSLTCTHTGITHQLVPAETGAWAPDGTDSYQLSKNWSGYEIEETAQYAQSGWTIPTVVNPPPPDGYSTTGYPSSTWVGVGGGAPLPLIQVGSDQYLSAYNVAAYRFWYGIVGGASQTVGEVVINPPLAHPGDDVGSAVIWQTSESTEYGICDFSDNSPPGGCVQMNLICNSQNPNHCTQQPGDAVEWIVEAPNVVGAPLADFGEVNFYNGCWAATYTGGTPSTCNPISDPGVTSPFSWELQLSVFGRTQTLASPSPITSGSSFTDLYQVPDRGN